MSYPSAFTTIPAALALFAAILLLLEVGRRIGLRDVAKNPETAEKGFGSLEGAVFGLMGLLIGFTFSGAGSRFDTRRTEIAAEANAIATAYLRINLLPSGAQPRLRDEFRQYLDSRLAFYQNFPRDIAAAEAAEDRVASLQNEIWQQEVEATREVSAQANANAVTSLVLQSMNEMIDFTTTRTAALEYHPPAPVYWMLIVLVLACSVLAGYETASRSTRSWVHNLAFAAIVAISILMIIDYEYPRGFGLIGMESSDQVLIDLRNKIR